MELKENYRWLTKMSQPPKMIKEFLNLYGIQEVEGTESNPIILEWAKELGVSSVYRSDDIPWCGLAMAIVARNAGKEIPEGFLWAMNWCKFGTKISFADASLGDILVFTRAAGGHVGEYIGEDGNAYHVAGGNEGNMMNIVRIAKDRLYCVRRPIWKISQPESVKKIYLLSNGLLSTNEK
jgi:uncharacterized protein (TIGR02594 family)